MLKKLLIFFKIIDEVQIPVPIKRGAARKPMHMSEKKMPEVLVPAGIVPIKRAIVRKREKIKDFKEYTENYMEYCLEKTSNQHMMKVSSYKVINRNESTETVFIQNDAFITHNEHKMIRIESPYFVKYIQQEYNPITQLNENAYD
ncbi:hypothetical protein [Chryseobacterium sp.]|uniref:hypothetical protein n=1 Tax=Chryseobacterium sp. TaxID=1871047 RepID=UPI002632D305|nr:hypothetical protein [Chryseobacterium sp.]